MDEDELDRFMTKQAKSLLQALKEDPAAGAAVSASSNPPPASNTHTHVHLARAPRACPGSRNHTLSAAVGAS